MATYTTYAWDGYNSQETKEIVPTMGQNTGMATGRAGVIFQMEEPMDDTHQQSMFSAEDSHARTIQLQETARDWLVTVALSGGNITASSLRDAPLGLSQRMCLGFSVATTVETSRQSSIPSLNAGMAWSGQCLMLSTSEWRNDAAVCSLSDILEANPDPKYSLSAKACRGILHRAEKRGKTLPPQLAAILQAVGDTQYKQNSSDDQ